MYMRSSSDILGCVAGLLYASNNQNMNHIIPALPVAKTIPIMISYFPSKQQMQS